MTIEQLSEGDIQRIATALLDMWAAAEPTELKFGMVVNPGDRVLLVLGDDATPEDIERFQAALTSRFPGALFTAVVGVKDIVVQLAEDVPELDGSAPNAS